MKNIKDQLSPFQLSAEEWEKLDKKFGELCKFAGWQLLRKNLKNSHTDELDDIVQELTAAVITAAMYYKRQIYIEACLEKVKEFCKDEKDNEVIVELDDLWNNRTKHGANKQKFGVNQEVILFNLVEQYVPQSYRPNPKETLKMDNSFATYCKAICWNKQKTLGKKITRERAIRNGVVSLSVYSHLDNSELEL